MQKQIHVKLEEELHRNIRVKAAELGQSLQEYVVNTLHYSVNEQLALYTTKRKNLDDSVEGDFTFIDLFAGIGGTRIAFQNSCGKCVFSSEWDAHCKKTYFDNFGEVPEGDITKMD